MYARILQCDAIDVPVRAFERDPATGIEPGKFDIAFGSHQCIRGRSGVARSRIGSK